MSKTAKIGDRIRILKHVLGGKSDRELEMGGLPGGKWLISNGLLSKWEGKGIEFSSTTLDTFLNHYNVSRAWWKTGEGEVFNSKMNGNNTHGDIEPAVAGKSPDEPTELFQQVVRVGSTEYVVLPKTTLDGEYRIMPKKELDKYERQFDKIDQRTQVALNAKDEVIMMKDELLRDRDQKLREKDERILSLEKQLSGLPGQKTQ